VDAAPGGCEREHAGRTPGVELAPSSAPRAATTAPSVASCPPQLLRVPVWEVAKSNPRFSNSSTYNFFRHETFAFDHGRLACAALPPPALGKHS
jgi:hypothetical protein